MDEVIGVVESAGNYDDAAKVKVGGVWFSNKFKPLPGGVEKGATVKIRYQHNPNYKGQFWKSISLESGGPGPVAVKAPNKPTEFPIEYDSRSRSIVRQNALTNAVKAAVVMTELGVMDAYTSDNVIKLAMEFEEYTSGDLDKRVMEETTKSMDAE